MAVDATVELDTRERTSSTLPSIRMSLRFRPLTARARRATVGRTEEGYPYSKPFRVAVIFSGAARLATASAAGVPDDDYPEVSCECPSPALQVDLAHVADSILRRQRGKEALPEPSPPAGPALKFGVQRRALRLYSREGPDAQERLPLPFSPAQHGEPLGRAFGYRSGTAALLFGTITIDPPTRGSGRHPRRPSLLQIAALLATPVSQRRDGREQGAFIGVPAAFPREVVPEPDLRDGTFLILQAPREPSFEIEGIAGRLFPANPRVSRFDVAKSTFDRVDFGSSAPTVGLDDLRWPPEPRNAPFVWQLSNDREISAATGRTAQFGVLAGLALGVAASFAVLMLERAAEHWQPGRTLRRTRRAVAAFLGLLLTIAELGWMAIDARAAVLNALLALALWLYVAWTAVRPPRSSLTQATRGMLTVLLYGWIAAFLTVWRLVWRGGWRGAWIVAAVVGLAFALALAGAYHVRRLEQRRALPPVARLAPSAIVLAVITGLFIVEGDPGGIGLTVVLIAGTLVWLRHPRGSNRERRNAGA